MSTDQPPPTKPRMKSKQRTLREELDGLSLNVAEIKQFCESASIRQGRRELIAPEDVLPHGLFLRRPYAVEEVARIAAGCAGETPHDRIQAALELLAAAEDIANPNPHENQHLSRREDDGLGDVPDLDAEKVMFDLEQQVTGIIEKATNEAGKIDRMELCKNACAKAGREVSDDRTEKLFHEWLSEAADDYGRWGTFLQIMSEPQRPSEAVELARVELGKISAKSKTLAAGCQELRDERKTAFEKELSGAKIAKIEAKLAGAEERFHASKEDVRAAERRLRCAIAKVPEDEVERRRKEMTEEQREAEREAFRLMLESGTGNQKRIIHHDGAARALLQGMPDFTGLLKFLKFPDAKESRKTRRPRITDELGHPTKQVRSAATQTFTKGSAANAGPDEYSTPGLIKTPVERTDDNRWRKKV